MKRKKSILVEDMEHCIFCNCPLVEVHHVFFGMANRKIADQYGLVVPLCNKHHTGSADSPHKNRIIDLALKCWGQSIYETKIGNRISFRKDFGKSYL